MRQARSARYDCRMRLPITGALAETLSRIKCAYLEQAKWHPSVLGYGGYGSEREVRVLCRVLMTRANPSLTWLEGKRGWRQFLDSQVPRHPVLVRVGRAVRIVNADRGGYVDVYLRGHKLSPGWHTATVHVINRQDMKRARSELFAGIGWGHLTPEALALRARRLRIRLGHGLLIPIRIIGPEERVGIISDVDDTIMVSMVPRPLLAARHALIDRISSRQAVPGMASFLNYLQYEAGELSQEPEESAAPPLKKDTEGSVPPPLVFLSTGAWNTAALLRRFLIREGFPRSSLLLRAWWLTDQGAPTGGSAFKLSQFRELVRMLPHVRWILVGDSGQHDPQTFKTVAERWPNSVAAVAIRTLLPAQQVRSHGSRIERWRLGPEDLPDGVPLIHGDDGHLLLQEAQEPGFREMLRARIARRFEADL